MSDIEKQTETWKVFSPEWNICPKDVEDEIRDIWAEWELSNGDTWKIREYKEDPDNDWHEAHWSKFYPALYAYLEGHDFTHIYYSW